MAVDAAGPDRQVVADQLAAAASEDRWPFDKAVPLLLLLLLAESHPTRGLVGSILRRISVCLKDEIRASTESAKPEGTGEHFLAHDRSAAETGRRTDDDPPRQAEHHFLRQIFPWPN
jgi:hypothetical protein